LCVPCRERAQAAASVATLAEGEAAAERHAEETRAALRKQVGEMMPLHYPIQLLTCVDTHLCRLSCACIII
jgi:hypothetical protein